MRNYTVTIQNPIPVLLALLAFTIFAGILVLGIAAAGSVANQVPVADSPSRSELVVMFGGETSVPILD